nr:DegV family protein [Lacticaseibacillus sharpeae]
MKTAIVTDSSAYLSPEEARAMNITVVPLTVIFGQQEYFENETISSADFYTRMATEDALPTTAQAPLARLDQEYRRLAAAGYDQVLSIHLSAALSGWWTACAVLSPTTSQSTWWSLTRSPSPRGWGTR